MLSIFIIVLNGLPGAGQSQPKHIKDIIIKNIYMVLSVVYWLFGYYVTFHVPVRRIHSLFYCVCNELLK